jgi:sulfite exporter TauE/SafE/copper chaperone CopZ
MKKKMTIRLGGLHCKACEILNEQNLRALSGIASVRVDHRDGLAEIYYRGDKPDPVTIRKTIEEAGYQYGGEIDNGDKTTEKPKAAIDCARPAQDKKANWPLIIPALILTYWLIGRLPLGDASGFLKGEFSLSLAILVGLVAGFSTCLALVGGLIFSLSANYAQNHPEASRAQKFQPHLFFNIGRVLGFFILGGILGLVGQAFKLSPFFNGLLTVIVGAVILVLGLKLLDVSSVLNKLDFSLPKRLSGWIKADSPFFLGALTFFLPCGFTQAMQVYALGSGSFWNGGLIMALFALGTAPGLLGIGGLVSIASQSKSRWFFKLAGVIVILFALFNLQNGFKLISLTTGGIIIPSDNGLASNDLDGKKADNKSDDESGVQVVRMVEINRGYSPNDFTVVKGRPVRWIIDAQAPYSCASALIVPSLKIQKFLKKGENIIEFTPTATGDIPFSCSMGM